MYPVSSTVAAPRNARVQPAQAQASVSAQALTIQRVSAPYLHPTGALPARLTPHAAPPSAPGLIERWSQGRLNSRLRKAVRDGELHNVRNLLSNPLRCPELGAVSRHGHVALHHAIRAGRGDLVELLLEHGANAGQREPASGTSPLQLTVQTGEFQLFPTLLARVSLADPDVRRDLLQAHSRVREVDPFQAGIEEASHSLLQAGLVGALKAGDFDAARRWLKTGADARLPLQGLAPLHHAVIAGRADLLDLLIGYGADPEQREPATGKTPLQLAVASERFQVIPWLASHIHAADSEARQGLMQVYSTMSRPEPLQVPGAQEAAQALLELGFASAVKAGDVRAAREWLQAGADPNRVDPVTRDTALHRAATSGDLALAKVLAMNGRTVDRPDSKGRYASDLARETAARFDSLQEDVQEFQDCFRQVGLASSVKLRDVEAMRRFLADGADPFRLDDNGETAASIAVAAGSFAMAKAMGLKPVALQAMLVSQNGAALRDPDCLDRPAPMRRMTSSLQTAREFVHGLHRLPAREAERVASLEAYFVRANLGCRAHHILIAEQYMLRLSRQIHDEVPADRLVAACLANAWDYAGAGLDTAIGRFGSFAAHLGCTEKDLFDLRFAVMKDLDFRLTVGDAGPSRT